MDPLTKPLIPAGYVAFAKAVGALADSHGIRACQLKIQPDWKDDDNLGHRIHGDVQINFAAKDGRGRPCSNLEIYVSTHSIIPVISNPESIG